MTAERTGIMNIEQITSRNNDYIKETVRLSDRGYRESVGKFSFEGRKLFEEAVKEKIPLEAVFVKDSLLSEFAEKDYPFRVISVSDGVYEKISYEKSPEGIFCVSKALDKLHILYIIYKGRVLNSPILILDGIRDPGNLGTILRTASAFGYGNVIMSEDCADIYNPKTVRASMGTVFRQPTVRVRELSLTVSALRENGFKIYSAALDKNAVSVKNIVTDASVAFIVGNEGNGIRREVIDASNGTVIIPMESGTESLNAAAAATVLLWEQYSSVKLRQSRK